MYEIWEIVKFNDYEFEPLILIDKKDYLDEAIKIKDKSQNYILTDNKGNLIDVKK